ncbi:hypothetical protein NPIL_630051 [Nephila pilipes]|uniref:Uncharacterized protein n=1 Tax=Nephila pilipes TaxID=299642 RepID=A0A8X6UW21_NEPPI|nr:hypothetical protein NPIL_630051 [Nephila pilipes]
MTVLEPNEMEVVSFNCEFQWHLSALLVFIPSSLLHLSGKAIHHKRCHYAQNTPKSGWVMDKVLITFMDLQPPTRELLKSVRCGKFKCFPLHCKYKCNVRVTYSEERESP